jgi:hypothetical protein
MGGADEIRFLAGLSESAKWNQKDEQANAFHGRPIVMLDGETGGAPSLHPVNSALENCRMN